MQLTQGGMQACSTIVASCIPHKRSMQNSRVVYAEFSRPTAHPSAADMSVPSSFDMASQVSQDSSFHHMTTLQELMPTQSASSMDSMALQHPPAVQPPMQQSATAPSSALSERDETVTSFSDPLAHPPVPQMLPVTEHDMHQRSASSSRAVGDVRPASAAASSVDYASQMSADADDASSVEVNISRHVLFLYRSRAALLVCISLICTGVGEAQAVRGI